MNNAFVVGMTGPTGSGKSTVGKLLCERGFKIVDADRVARRVTEKGSPTLAVLCANFGDDILLQSGELDRAELAKRAFADKEGLEMLNSITHPAIISLIKEEIEALKASGETKIILDAPQLFEAGAQSLCDFILSVLADRETRLERIKKRDNITDEQAESRINAQKSDEFFVENSDLVIYNNSDTASLTPQIDLLLEKMEVRKVDTNSNACQPFSTDTETQERIEKSNQRPSAKKRMAFFGAIAACAVAVIVIAIVLLTSGKGYDKVIDKSLEVCKSPSVESIKAIYPEQIWDFMLEMYSAIDEVDKTEDIIEKYLLPETQKISDKVYQELGDDWSLEYEVITEETLTAEAREKIAADISKLTENEIKIKEAVEVNLTYKITGNKTRDGFMNFVAVKIDGEWYAAEESSGGWMINILEF